MCVQKRNFVDGSYINSFAPTPIISSNIYTNNNKILESEHLVEHSYANYLNYVQIPFPKFLSRKHVIR